MFKETKNQSYWRKWKT